MNSFSTGSFGGNIATGYGGAGCSATATITATVTATWVSATGQTTATDPAPPSVWLCEGGSVGWVSTASGPGSGDDGLGETGSTTYEQMGSVNSGSAPASVPPAHWTKYAVSGGVVHLPPRTLTATSSVPQFLGGRADAWVYSYSVTVHAQPYNFRQTTGTDNLDGTISFTYGWQSTSGSIADLITCYLHERVTYPGSNNSYVAPVPFTQSMGYPNPTVAPGTGNAGIAMTSTSTNQDTHHLWATSSNYSDFTSVTVSATQRYEFDDVGDGSNPGTGEVNVLIPGPDSTPTITRAIYPVGSPPYLPDWWYSVTKNGVTATKKVASHP